MVAFRQKTPQTETNKKIPAPNFSLYEAAFFFETIKSLFSVKQNKNKIHNCMALFNLCCKELLKFSLDYTRNVRKRLLQSQTEMTVLNNL